MSAFPSARIIEILERKKEREGRGRGEKERKGDGDARPRAREKKRMPPRRIALLMESWLSVGSSYNVHYIYLSPWVCGPARIPTGGSSPTAEHKAVKRFNSIRAAERGLGSQGGFIEFNASAAFALWKSPRRGLRTPHRRLQRTHIGGIRYSLIPLLFLFGHLANGSRLIAIAGDFLCVTGAKQCVRVRNCSVRRVKINRRLIQSESVETLALRIRSWSMRVNISIRLE